MPLQYGARDRIGLLQIDAPVFQFVERDPHVGDGAAHIGSWRDHAEIAVQILHLRFAMARGTEFIEHRKPLRLAARGLALSIFSKFRSIINRSYCPPRKLTYL